MNFLKDIFNCNATPRTIVSLPSKGPGYKVNELCGRDVTRYSTFSYSYQLYARRVENKKYNVYVKYNDHDGDSGKAMLRCGIPLSEAIGVVRAHDDRETQNRLGHLPASDHAAFEKSYIAPKRGKNNVRRVQQRLTLANPMGH